MADDTTAIQPYKLTPDAINQAMIQAGLVTAVTGGSDWNRVKIDGTNFNFGGSKDEPPEFILPSLPNGTPAFRAQILGDIEEEYNHFFNEAEARAANRPSIANKMCRSSIDKPAEAGKHAFDGAPCESCVVSHFIPKKEEQDRLPMLGDNGSRSKKCSWGGILEFRLLDENGTITDERIWSLSLTSTGVIEWQGSFYDTSKGYISEHNTKQKMALLAAQHAAAAVGPGEIPDIAGAVAAATHSFHNGGLLVEARALRANNPQSGFTWSIPSFTPYEILAVETAPEITTAEQPATAPEVLDDIPF